MAVRGRGNPPKRPRQKGYAVDNGNYIAGVHVVAAPVLGRIAGVSHALIAIGIAGSIQRAGADTLGRALMEAGMAISEQMPGG
ncbi:MAG TPA: IclR family transcriptional regulator C-terminal domain-containing protein [Rhizobiaceae bacterium]|nr:IclR family transcriptional regulator C-terminal domain-containing protein [Rhizobiaceae bacterium]